MDTTYDIVCQQCNAFALSCKSSKKSPKTTTHSTEMHFKMRRLYALLVFCALFVGSQGCGPGRGIGGPHPRRKLKPLVFKEHYPKMPEYNLGASGRPEGPIPRESPKFKDLVPNYSRDIKFKDDEGTGADRLMSKRCKQILDTLALSVMNTWPNVRLLVIESWDEDDFHGAESLHYEGRAVDIATSDRDHSKYGMLARLAVEAGFDWVYYESRTHIHCSVKADKFAHRPHHNGCFAKDSTVLTANGTRKPLSELEIGDSVLSMNEQGDAVYSEVILFMDRNLAAAEEFVQLQTDGGATLRLTPAHLVWAWNQESEKSAYTFADRVQEGDSLLVYDTTGALRPQRVVKISSVRGLGYVAPLTRAGTIVVDSVAASCYAIINSQSVAHWSLGPMRLWTSIKEWFPTKSKLRSKPAAAANALEYADKTKTTGKVLDSIPQNGVHWYARALYTLKDYVLPPTWRYESFHA